jgi:hypothetical protein
VCTIVLSSVEMNNCHTAVSLASVKLKLLKQESEEIQKGVVSTLDDVVSHSVLISVGLELEEQQYVG